MFCNAEEIGDIYGNLMSWMNVIRFVCEKKLVMESNSEGTWKSMLRVLYYGKDNHAFGVRLLFCQLSFCFDDLSSGTPTCNCEIESA